MDPHSLNLNLRDLWPKLSSIARIYLVILSFISVWTFISLQQHLLKLRSLKRSLADLSVESIHSTLAAMQDRLSTLRRLFSFAFLLFGFCFVLQVSQAFIVFGDASAPPIAIILRQLDTCLAYAADVLLVFLLLYSLQWFVSARLEAFARK
jgi:hypothetical protein